MSIIDKVRSFAEARCRDEEVVPCGFTYGDMRELLTALSEPTDAQRALVCQEIWNEPTLDPSIMLLGYEARIRARMARGRRSQSND